MNIIQALIWSRDNHASVSRNSDQGFMGWIRYADDFTFKLKGVDLLATDWIPTAELIEQVTQGEWQHVESDGKL